MRTTCRIEPPKRLPLKKVIKMSPKAKRTNTSTCINETIMKTTISESKAAKIVDVCGYRRYSLLARFEGPPNGTFKLEINNNNKLDNNNNINMLNNNKLNNNKINKLKQQEL